MAKKKRYEIEKGSCRYNHTEYDQPRKKKTNPIKERRSNNKIWFGEYDVDEEWYDVESKFRK